MNKDVKRKKEKTKYSSMPCYCVSRFGFVFCLKFSEVVLDYSKMRQRWTLLPTVVFFLYMYRDIDIQRDIDICTHYVVLPRW